MCKDVYCSITYNREKPEISYMRSDRKWLHQLWSISIVEAYIVTKHVFEEYLITWEVIYDTVA